MNEILRDAEVMIETVSIFGTETEVRIAGKIDSTSGNIVQQALHQILLERPEVIRLDLQNVFRISPLGVFALIEIYRQAHQQGTALLVTKWSPEVRSTLEILEFDDLLLSPSPENRADDAALGQALTTSMTSCDAPCTESGSGGGVKHENLK